MICSIPESAVIKCFWNWNKLRWELHLSNIDITWGWRSTFVTLLLHLRYGIDFLTKAKFSHTSWIAFKEVCLKYSPLHWGWMSELHCNAKRAMHRSFWTKLKSHTFFVLHYRKHISNIFVLLIAWQYYQEWPEFPQNHLISLISKRGFIKGYLCVLIRT